MASWSSLISLLVLFIAVGVTGFIGYHMYLWSNELADRANKKMEKKHIAFSKDGGLRVGVKHVQEESYRDKTQNVLVNVWNNAAFPNYKSNLGWNSTQGTGKKSAAAAAASSSSSSSSSRSGREHIAPATSTMSHQPTAAKGTGSSSNALPVPASRGHAHRRSASPVPGGWD